jgi:G:T-mismatch repair DNA endonuclease (very short patch repair protein)
MAQVKADFLDQTVTFWQPRTSRKLTREDGRQIAENVSAFFRILLEWEAAERSVATAAAEKEFIASPLAGGRLG